MRAAFLATLAAACSLAVPVVALADTVGGVAAVKQEAFGTPPNAAKAQKQKGDAIAFQELLETLKQSGMLVRFNDGSELTLGASSQVRVDAFVYAPGNSASKALMAIPAGTLRYVTGAMPKGQTTIDTPTATMVLRGTNVTVAVGSDGETELYVKEGKVSVHNKITGEDTLVDAGSGVDIGSNGITDSHQDETGDPVIDDGLGGPDTGNGPDTTPEHRRGDGAKRSEPNRGGSKSGGSPSGGSTPG